MVAEYVYPYGFLHKTSVYIYVVAKKSKLVEPQKGGRATEHVAPI